MGWHVSKTAILITTTYNTQNTTDIDRNRSIILQESFTRYLEKYGQEGPNTALLYTIARNAWSTVPQTGARYAALR
jgi:hypothetical protein